MPASLLLQIAIIISRRPALLVGIRALSLSSVLCRKKLTATYPQRFYSGTSRGRKLRRDQLTRVHREMAGGDRASIARATHSSTAKLPELLMSAST